MFFIISIIIVVIVFVVVFVIDVAQSFLLLFIICIKYLDYPSE